MMEIEFFRLSVGTYTDEDLILVHIFEECSQKSVPEGKYGTVIGVPLLDDDGMMYPMHGRGDEKDPEQGFEPPGNLYGAVLKLGAHNHSALKYPHAYRARAQEKYE